MRGSKGVRNCPRAGRESLAHMSPRICQVKGWGRREKGGRNAAWLPWEQKKEELLGSVLLNLS